MSATTGIGWTDSTWPIVNGCKAKSTGCLECYAAYLAATRLAHTPKYKGLAVLQNGRAKWTGESRLWRPHLDWPMKWRKPRRVFVANMGDLFHPTVTQVEQAAVYAIMAACPHTFQILTKSAEEALAFYEWVEAEAAGRFKAQALGCHAAAAWKDDEPTAALLYKAVLRASKGDPRTSGGFQWPLPNVWVGVSAENQEEADKRCAVLAKIPAARRFLSAEPLLGPIRLRPEWKLDWVIPGGESGKRARPTQVTHIRQLVEQALEMGIAPFVKQLGADVRAPAATLPGKDFPGKPRRVDTGQGDFRVLLKSKMGKNPEEWPGDLRVQTFPADVKNWWQAA